MLKLHTAGIDVGIDTTGEHAIVGVFWSKNLVAKTAFDDTRKCMVFACVC